MRHLVLACCWLPCLVTTVDAADLVTLTSDRTTVVLDRQRQGAVVSIVDNTTDAEFIDPPAASELFAIGWSRPGDTSGTLQRLTARDAAEIQWQVRDQSVTATYQRLGGNDVTVSCTVSVEAATGEHCWQLGVSGSAAMMLEEVNFPTLALRAPLLDEGQADAVVMGLTKGGVFHQPVQWSVGRGLSVTQPGQLAAQFGCYYSPQAGLLSYSRDARGFPKRLDCRRTKEGLQWIWQHRCYQCVDEPFELAYQVSTTTFVGAPTDWRDGADIYKRWAVTQPWCAVPYAQRSDVPAWMKAGPAMIRFHRDWLDQPQRVRGWLEDYWRQCFPAAPLIVGLWGWERVGSWVSPKYFPPFPTEQSFRQVVDAARHVDGHAFPWPSGYYWNVEYEQQGDGTFAWQDWDDFNTQGLPHALRQRDGTPLVRQLPWLKGGRNAVLCRGDAWTRQWFDQLAVTLMQLGCDMVQVDQVVGGLAPGGGECFSTSHGHPPGPGVWDAEAFAQQLKSLAAACRAIQPEAVLSIEEPQELFNHLIGVQDYRDAQSHGLPALPGRTHASVFGYLYHEYLPVFQSNPQRGDLPSLAYCAVTGQIPHWVPHWPVSPSPALTNGSFEQWTGDEPTGWQRVKGWQDKVYSGRAFRDEAVRRQGTASLRLENTGEEEVVQVSQNVPVGTGYLQPGHTYRLRAQARVEHLVRANAMNLAALTKELSSKGSWRIPFPARGDWAAGSVEFTMPRDATFLRIMLHVVGPCKVWVDDVILEERIAGDRWQPLLQPGLPPDHAFVKQWVELFHGAGRPYLLLGTMLHPPQLIEPAPVPGPPPPFAPIMLNAFRALDGSQAVVVANATQQKQAVRFRWQRQERSLVLDPWTLQLVR